MTREAFTLPDVGEGIAEGELVNWLVEEGDTVTEDQPVAEVETDKAVVDVPSPFDATVVERRAAEGEMVPVGDVIVVFETDEAAVDADEVRGSADGTGGADEAGSADGASGADEAGSGGAPEASGTAAAAGSPENGAGEAVEVTDEGVEQSEDGEVPVSEERVFAPPSARREARERGVDITAVEGTGPGGRITVADVRAHASGGGQTTAGGATADEGVSGPKPVDIDSGESAVSTSDGTGGSAGGGQSAAGVSDTPAVESADRDQTLAAPATRRVAREEGVDLDAVPTDQTRDGEAFVTAEQVRSYAEAQRAAQAADAAAAGEPSVSAADTAAQSTADTAAQSTADTAGASADAAASDTEGVAETVPYRGVRRTIGEKMAESKYTAPHVTHHDTAVVDELVATRERLQPRAEERDVSLTYMPFVVKAVVAALQEFPILNSQLNEEDEEIVVHDDYHVGIAVATDAGLMVPVVENADEKGLVELSAEISDLASRARSRDLSPAELRGSTFSITNFGVFGGEYATPIINYPETAILGLGELDERAVAEDGELRAAPTMPLSVSIDHRVIDGAEAAQFTNTVMEYLESPELLLL
jgi:pyruvate dehydrogenase E2 component (dihydrolipoamide acetyltransferase)